VWTKEDSKGHNRTYNNIRERIMDLKKIIQEENCLILKESKKTEVLIEMIKAIMQTGRAEDEENLKKRDIL
jgi:hypothetical protein